jgi:hypothetical protein
MHNSVSSFKLAAPPQGTTTRSIKYALGPQFGTIAFAGAIL